MPEARIGLREFNRHVKFSALGRRDELDRAFARLIRSGVPHGNDLILKESGSRFDERAVRVHDNRSGGFIEGLLIRALPFQDHGRLNQNPLAASPTRVGIHYREPFG